MIDERDLRALLAEAADAAPPPGRAPDELLAALRADDTGRTTRVPDAAYRASRRTVLLAVAAVVVALLLVQIAPGDQLPGPSFGSDDDAELTADQAERDLIELEAGGTTGGTDGGADRGRTGAPVSTTVPARMPRLAPGFGELLEGSDAIEDLDSGAGASGGGGAAAPLAGGAGSAPVQAVDGAMVVKTGSLVLEVGDGAYEGTVDRIRSTANGLGGYVAESTTNRSEDSLSGTITVRVPATQFDGFLDGLRELGRVESEDVRGADVSAQHTDLEARLASVTATRDRLQTLLGEASNVGDLIMIQDRITGVQTEIEQLQGQLRLLDDQVAMGTLGVRLAEPGAEQVELTTEEDDGGLGGAWDDARRRFGDALEGLLAWSGTLAVLALLAAAGLAAYRFGRRRLRRTLL